MHLVKQPVRYVSIFLLVGFLAADALSQGPPPGRGPGFGRGGQGRGMGLGRGARAQSEPGAQNDAEHGPPGDDRHDEDRDVFHFLLEHHESIRREVKEIENGVETLTESDDPEIAAKIKEHVEWMEHRVKEIQPIRMRDPLFAELFRNAEKIEMRHEDTEKGVKVVETSADPRVAMLIKEHARTVSKFVQRGFDEAMLQHPVPGDAVQTKEAVTPRIEGYGKVVQLSEAVMQPRSGSQICVDITKGGPADTLNPAIEKMAKYVNIFAAAGKEPADLNLAIVLHGEATLCVLNDDAYAKSLGVDKNPNLDCLRKLHDAGVMIYVCGQSLLEKGGKPEETVVFVDVAVSALTALVNLQADGYAYMPMLK